MFARIFDTRSIEAHLRWINLITIGGAFLLAAALLIPQRIAAEEERLLGDIRQKSLWVARNGTAALASRNKKAATDLLASLDTSRNVIEAVLWTADNRILATYGGGSNELPAGSLRSPLRSGSALTRDSAELNEPVSLDGVRVGQFYLHIDVRETRERLR